MSTKLILQLDRIDSREVGVHIDVKLRAEGRYIPDGCTGDEVDFVNDSEFTPGGKLISDALATVRGTHILYDQYELWVSVAQAFDMLDTLWETLQAIKAAIGDDIDFAVTLGDDAFERPELIRNPNWAQFELAVDDKVVIMRQRNDAELDNAISLLQYASSVIQATGLVIPDNAAGL